MSENLYDLLEKAILEGNREEISRIKRKILLTDRNMDLDRDYIEKIKDKPLGRSIKKIINTPIGELNDVEYKKLISSLITHTFIESSKSGVPPEDYGLRDMYIILGKVINKDEFAIREVRNFVEDRYSEFL